MSFSFSTVAAPDCASGVSIEHLGDNFGVGIVELAGFRFLTDFQRRVSEHFADDVVRKLVDDLLFGGGEIRQPSQGLLQLLLPNAFRAPAEARDQAAGPAYPFFNFKSSQLFADNFFGFDNFGRFPKALFTLHLLQISEIDKLDAGKTSYLRIDVPRQTDVDDEKPAGALQQHRLQQFGCDEQFMGAVSAKDQIGRGDMRGQSVEMLYPGMEAGELFATFLGMPAQKSEICDAHIVQVVRAVFGHLPRAEDDHVCIFVNTGMILYRIDREPSERYLGAIDSGFRARAFAGPQCRLEHEREMVSRKAFAFRLHVGVLQLPLNLGLADCDGIQSGSGAKEVVDGLQTVISSGKINQGLPLHSGARGEEIEKAGEEAGLPGNPQAGIRSEMGTSIFCAGRLKNIRRGDTKLQTIARAYENDFKFRIDFG